MSPSESRNSPCPGRPRPRNRSPAALAPAAAASAAAVPWFDGEACGSIGAFSTPTGSAAALQRKAAGWLSLHGKTRAARPPGRGPVQAHLPGIWRALGIHRSRRLPGPSSRVRCLCARRWPESVDECEKDHNFMPQRRVTLHHWPRGGFVLTNYKYIYTQSNSAVMAVTLTRG